MKFKTLLIILALLFLSIGSAWQYRRVNQKVKQPLVVEKIFHQGEWVTDQNVRFKVTQIEHQSATTEKRVKVHLQIQQLGAYRYGLKSGNANLAENMWLNIPYAISNQSRGLTHPSGQLFTDQELHSPGLKSGFLAFTVPDESYRARLQEARFSFLLSQSSGQFFKYSLLLHLT